ncbi:Helicase SKI2W [Bulinus truncatus]|nr:Helicase SKI2W [Bulinus truncatus]
MTSAGDGVDLMVNSLKLLEAGSLGHLDCVPLQLNSSPDALEFPLLTLPVGIPPVLSSLEQEVQAYVSEPENLPIHHFAPSQKLIRRNQNFDRLLNLEICIPETTIQVERNQTTGHLLGYTEEINQDSSKTSRNSLSLCRAPDVNNLKANQDVRGSTINLPFWPGGLDEDIFQDQASSDITTSSSVDLDDESKFLTTPPGFKHGLTFDNFSEKAKDLNVIVDQTLDKPGVISLEDILSGADELDLGDSEDEEPVLSSPSKEKETEQPQLPRTESLEKLIETDVGSQQMLHKSTSPVKEQWAVQVDVTAPVDDFHKKIPDMAYEWPFELDIFQKQAILHIENYDSVFVAAHTSAGKTVVAEYAIALSIKHMTRTIYTSPIKALSNQKYREFKITFQDVGLVTGDVQMNQTASCLIMTTEILRSMLYNGSDIIRDLEWVIFDEVHYINDSERGVVWEEVLIMLPAHVSVILLSATVPNCMEFADWVGRIKQKKIYVVSTLKRPVPLEHYLYTGNSIKTCNEMFLLIDAKGSFLNSGYIKALEAKKERASKSSQNFGAKGTRGAPPNQELDGEITKVITAKYLFVAVSSETNKPGVVNPLDPQTPEEKELFQLGEENRKRRQKEDMLSLLKSPPTEQERLIIHDLFLSTVDLNSGTFKVRVKPDNSIWMEDTIKKSLLICHPEQRNLYNKTFGGFLMRMAYELAWANASIYADKRPKMCKIVDDILFKRPVEIGSVLLLSSQVVYTKGPDLQVHVHAEVYNLDVGSQESTNDFHFTFDTGVPNLPQVIPKTYSEAMLYLVGKRHYES